MQNIKFIFIILFILGCSSTKERTKWSDKNLRLMLDPASLSAEDYVAVQTALFKSDKFTVVDRSKGFNAIKNEQNRTHRTEEDRYADKEKWSHWGKLYGVGGIVVGHSQCFRAKPFFSLTPYVQRCKQFLSIVDSNTGEVIAAVEGQNDKSAAIEAGSFNEPSDWTETVEKLVDAYPKDYKPKYYSEGLQKYRDLSEEEAKRQREVSSEK